MGDRDCSPFIEKWKKSEYQPFLQNPYETGDFMQQAKVTIGFLVLFLCAIPTGVHAKEITVTLTVPDSTWTLTIDEVHQVGEALWVIATVASNPDIMGAQVISTLQASLDLSVPDLPVSVFVIGKTWGWANEEPYTFIQDRSQIDKNLEAGKLLYEALKK